MKALYYAFLSAIVLTGISCSQKASIPRNITHTQLTATAGGHHIIADIEGEAGIHNYITPSQAVITSRWCSLMISRTGVYFGTNEITENRWIELPNDVPITLCITQEKFTLQWGTNQVTKTPNTSLEPTAVDAVSYAFASRPASPVAQF